MLFERAETHWKTFNLMCNDGGMCCNPPNGLLKGGRTDDERNAAVDKDHVFCKLRFEICSSSCKIEFCICDAKLKLVFSSFDSHH
jgi:hypothetical protein